MKWPILRKLRMNKRTTPITMQKAQTGTMKKKGIRTRFSHIAESGFAGIESH